MITPDDLHDRLHGLIERHGIPGAAIGLLAGGETVEAAAGVLATETGVEATTDSLFQIGSITKLLTATAAMALVERGAIGLDAPLSATLPELGQRDAAAGRAVTLRDLLAHTSGIDGDMFDDLGRGDDVLARVLAAVAGLPQLHPAGAAISYCNVGYSIAGRLIERLTGATWDAALADLVLRPAGLGSTVTLPEQALPRRVAMSHLVQPDGSSRPAPRWGLPRSVGPAGNACATVGDLLRLARLAIDRGSLDGTALLSPATVDAMLAPQATLPGRWQEVSGWGLGWFLGDCDGTAMVGHDGATIGQAAYLRVLPERRAAVALLTNRDATRAAFEELAAELLEPLAGVRMPRSPVPAADAPAVDGERFAGRYERASSRIDVAAVDGRLRVHARQLGAIARLADDGIHELEVAPVDPAAGMFAARLGAGRLWAPMTFYELPDGSPQLHYGFRSSPRVA